MPEVWKKVSKTDKEKTIRHSNQEKRQQDKKIPCRVCEDWQPFMIVYSIHTMRGTFVKRRYAEARIGAVVLNPILAASTFLGVAYLYIQEHLPFFIFAPIFLIGMTAIVTVVGFKFRNIQLSTDEDIKYEKQKDFNRTLYEIMLALDDGSRSKSFYERLDYVEKICKS